MLKLVWIHAQILPPTPNHPFSAMSYLNLTAIVLLITSQKISTVSKIKPPSNNMNNVPNTPIVMMVIQIVNRVNPTSIPVDCKDLSA